MESPLISVVVPCYNASTYISASFASLSNQTYPHWECIAVNDGSTDNTEQKIQEWVQKDPRFKLINQENAGPPAARNTGLNHFTGDFLFFLDADDLLDPHCLETLLQLHQPSVDVVIGKSAEVLGQTTNGIKTVSHYDNGEKILDNEGLLKLSLVHALFPVIWNKLYAKDFIKKNNLAFLEGVVHDDEFWMFEIMHLAKKVVFASKVTYYYNVDNSDSITKNYSLKSLKSLLTVVEKMYSKYYLNEQDGERKKIFGTYIIHLQIDAISAFFRFLKKNKADFKAEGIALIEQHLEKHSVPEFTQLDSQRNKQYAIFIQYARRNPEVAFKLMRNLNKRNILKFFENIYLRIKN